MTNQKNLSQKIIPHFEALLGPVELQSPWHPFTHSHYYEEEFGPNLKRCLVSFKNIFDPHRLVELKQLASHLEYQTSNIKLQTLNLKRRTINIDPGYIDLFKVVLASGKAGGQKVALSKECFAYTLLRYEKGKWIPFEWTYPDFKSEIYHPELLKIRSFLKLSLPHRL